MRSRATRLSPPSGMMRSAQRFDGSTNCEVHGPHGRVVLVAHRLRRCGRAARCRAGCGGSARMSASVSTKILMSSWARSRASTKTRMPSTMTTGAGSTRRGLAARRAWSRSRSGDVDARARRAALQVRDEQLGLERVGVVVVDARALVARQVRAIAVVGVVVDEHDRSAAAAPPASSLGDGRLARAGAAGDAQHEHACRLHDAGFGHVSAGDETPQNDGNRGRPESRPRGLGAR